MDIYKLILGTLVVLLIAVVTRSEVPALMDERYANSSYSCEGNCVPVYFEIQTPEKHYPYSQIYVSGSFNGWKHADPALQMEEVEDSRYRATILLPDGASIKYRYTVGRDHTYGFSEYGDLRTLRVIEGHVRRDRISDWGAAVLTTDVWSPERLEQEAIQDRFLEKYFSAESTTDPITVNQVDSLFQVAEHMWKEEGLLYYPGYDKLISWTYSYLYERQMIVGEHTINPTTECYMLTEYALPAFVQEVEYIEATRNPERFGLLRNYNDMINVWSARISLMHNVPS